MRKSSEDFLLRHSYFCNNSFIPSLYLPMLVMVWVLLLIRFRFNQIDLVFLFDLKSIIQTIDRLLFKFKPFIIATRQFFFKINCKVLGNCFL